LTIRTWFAFYLFAFAVEVPIFILLVRGRVPPWRAALAGAAGTAFTHPLLWFVWPKVVRGYAAYAISGELLTFVIETFTFFFIAGTISLRRAATASFAANAASLLLGFLVQYALLT